VWESQASGNTSDFEGLIRHVTVTAARHALYGQQLEILQLISDRGATWVTVRVPNGSCCNIKRAHTDLAQPLSDSKSSLIVSAAVALRVASFVETLSRRGGKETGDDDKHIAGACGENAVPVAQVVGTDPSTTGGATSTRSVPEAAQPGRE
jgi:hypothetical protein